MNRRQFIQSALATAVSAATGAAHARPNRPQLVTVVPPAYMATAAQAGIPARLMYGIALQESSMAFGPIVAPWPWTLCVRGTPYRYATYQDAVRALHHVIAILKIRNVDCGPMQVNWGYHAEKLRTPELALDAYRNLDTGARILRECFDEAHDWFTATRWYHNRLDQGRGLAYAQSVFRRLPIITEGVIG